MSEVRIVALAAATAWFSFTHYLKVNIVIVTKVRNVALVAATARFSRTIVFHGFRDFQAILPVSSLIPFLKRLIASYRKANILSPLRNYLSANYNECRATNHFHKHYHAFVIHFSSCIIVNLFTMYQNMSLICTVAITQLIIFTYYK